jgi:hypothetical protein
VISLPVNGELGNIADLSVWMTGHLPIALGFWGNIIAAVAPVVAGKLLGGKGGSEGAPPKVKEVETLSPWALSLAKEMGKRVGQFGYQMPELNAPKDLLRQTILGDFLPMAANPYMQERIDSIQREAARRGDIERSTLGLQIGRLGPAFSVDAARAQTEQQRDISERTLGQVRELLNSQLERERQNQLAASAMFSDISQVPYRTALDLLSLGKGGVQPVAQPATPAKPGFLEQAASLAPAISNIVGAFKKG